MNIEDLIKRGFQKHHYMDLGKSFVKEYKGYNFWYSIIVSETGSVYITNFDEENSKTFCLNLSKEFTDDLLFIIPFVNK